MKSFNNIEEAKKFIDKTIYYPDSNDNVITPLYIGGVFIFFNSVNYEADGFAVYEDKECKKYWGKIEIKNIKDEFDGEEQWMVYTFSKELAKQYLANQRILRNQSEKIREIKLAKEMLDKHKINYEIFN